tara:strand:- start:210 stop:521 length:312 start_codon:yes stop_codon:yes gene_type:complete
MNKTLNIFKKYGLVEADEMDATDAAEQPPAPAPVSMTSEGEKYLVGLLIKAFLHVPDDSEGRIAKELQGQLENLDPKDIAGQIENFLEIGVDSTKAALDDIQV